MRRIFFAIVAGLAVAWPFGAGAQVANKPVIGFLGAQSPDTELLAKFHQGLGEFGYFEGRNVEVDYRWANNQNEKLNAMAASLAQRQVALIVTTGGMVSARAAKNATAEIPILFVSGLDPVENGLVESLSHPGGNITGISLFYREIIPKRLEVLKQTLPNVKSIAYLQNDDGTGLGSNEKFQFKAETAMANQLGLVVYYARNEPDLEPAFASMAQRRTDAMLVGSDPFFTNHRKQLVELAAKYSLPAAYQQRQFVDTGGLMSYGPSNREAWREIGQYAGRVLKGAPPKDLPVMMQSRFELAINMQTAKALGLPVPPLVHALADDVIE
jgi:putative ABC transport system substrate-binding protein